MDSINKVSLLSPHVWLSLSLETRAKIAEMFSLVKSGTPIVNIGPNGGEVISDGYSVGDFALITIHKMNEILGTDSKDFYELFDKIVDKVEGKEKVDEPDTLLVGEEIKVVPGEVLEIKKFCEFCTSKGGRHKLNCTRPQ